MMFGFGDVEAPLQSTVDTMEDLVASYVQVLVKKAQEGRTSGARAQLTEQDLLMQANERRIAQLQQQIDKERSARSLLEARVRELEKGEEVASGGVVPWLRDWLLGVG